MTSEATILRAELDEVREAANKREEELSTIVSNSKAIFQLNLTHEAAKIEKQCQALIEEKEERIRFLNAMVSAKDSSIADLSKRIAEFETEKQLALRDQRQSGMLSAELLSQNLKQTRALMEKSRYTSERLLQQKDVEIQSLRDQLSMLLSNQNHDILSHCRRCEDEEMRARHLLAEMQSDSFAFICQLRLDTNAMEENHHDQRRLILRRICEGAIMPLKSRVPNKVFSAPAINTVDVTIQYISSHFDFHLQQLEHEVVANADAHSRMVIANEGTRLRCLQLREQMTVFASDICGQLKVKDEALLRANEMLERLARKLSRQTTNKAAQQSSIDEVAKLYDEEVAALKGEVTSLKQELAESYKNAESLQTKLVYTHSQLENSKLTSEAPKSTTNLKSSAQHLEAQMSPENQRLNALPDVAAPMDPFSQWGANEGPEVPSSMEFREAQEEIDALRKELESARSNIVDLKALVRRLRLRPSSGAQSPRSYQSDDTVQEAELPSHAPQLPPPREADSDMQMQLFSLRRERDAWKRKADAALAQASHAEEQRLASVHTYLQLVGRKEEEHAHTILSGADTGHGKHYSTPKVQNDETSNSLMPGGNSRMGLDESALASLLSEVRTRGEQRAERWLSDKAEELRAQEGQLNRLREELALKASSLARREEALKHEKTGLLLKKGGLKPVGTSNVLLSAGGASVHEGPLRETYPTTRLQPLLQLPAPGSQAPKPHHPQRFVLSPLPNTSGSNV